MMFADALDEGAAAVADSLARLVGRFPKQAPLTDNQWSELADAGLFAIPELFAETPRTVIAAAMEILGRQGIASQAAAAFAFLAVAPGELASPVVEGVARVSLGRPPYMPAARPSDVFMSEDGGAAVLLAIDLLEPINTLSDEAWVRVIGATRQVLGPFRPAQDAYDLAISAWLVGAGLGLLEQAAEHAKHRRQFGRAIGEFQAVAGPLARASIGLDAAWTLVLSACATADNGDAGFAQIARASSGRAATAAALVAHQTFGALGMVDEGPVQAISKRIRQVSSQFPEDRRDGMDGALRPGRSLSLIDLDQGAREALDA